MSVAYSDASFGTANGTSPVVPMSAAPACAPLYEYSLKFLSLTVPTSVTTPTLSAFSDPAGEPDASAEPEAAAVGVVVAGAVVSDGVAPLEHAPATIASPASRLSFRERMVMLPPPAFRLTRPHRASADGIATAGRRPAGRPMARIVATGSGRGKSQKRDTLRR